MHTEYTARSRRRHVLLITALAVAVGAFASTSTADPTAATESRPEHAEPPEHAQRSEHDTRPARTIEFEVAENGSRFVFDEAPVDDDELPAHGNGFITEGYIFDAGTLDEDTDAITADGAVKPRDRDKVIGTWTCYGYFVGDGAQTAPHGGAWVVTTQLYEFDDGNTFVSSGQENPVGGPAAARAVTGGTGEYRHASGQITQEAFAFNASEGITARFIAEVTLE